MSDDLPNFDVADQLHDDLLVKRLTDSNNTGFANNLETGTSVDEVPKTAATWVFYRLVSPEIELISPSIKV
jgi:hypothetical protein